jgi:hypothetical protein
MTLSEQIDFFFAPPLPEQGGSLKSILHLNRREVQDCLLGDVIAEDQVVSDSRNHRLFATVMVIAAGIDLLGKFYAGSDKIGGPGGVGDRIIDFAERFMFAEQPIAHELAEVFYFGCRNPMLHSFTPHNDRFRITLTNELPSGAIWRATAPDGSIAYVVSVRGLYKAFIDAINRYRVELDKDPDLQAKFAAMFPDYGSIGFFSVIVQPVKGA